MTEVVLPIRTWSEPNIRGHWAKRARRVKRQREAARLLVRAAHPHTPGEGPVVVTLTRTAPRELDSDNLAASMKAVRDGVADALGMDDGDKRLTWLYDQRRGKPREYSVLVEIE